MSSIFSTQNLQTFLRRKNLRPPPPSRGGPPGPRPPPPPPNLGLSPLGRSPLDRGLSLGADCSAAFVSSAIILLEISCLPDVFSASTSWRPLRLFLSVLCGQKLLTARIKIAKKCRKE